MSAAEKQNVWIRKGRFTLWGMAVCAEASQIAFDCAGEIADNDFF